MEEYESLDFDMSIMTEVYEHGGKDLRSRIAATARRAGRLELVELVAGVRHRRRMGEMTIREWEVTFGIIDDRHDWTTLWRPGADGPGNMVGACTQAAGGSRMEARRQGRPRRIRHAMRSGTSVYGRSAHSRCCR